MKKLIVGAVLALAVAAFLPRAASAGVWGNGNWSNGIWENGIWENGNWSNGIWENGIWSNGNWSNGIWENGIWDNGIWENGRSGNGAALLGREPGGAGAQCRADRVDLSAVPLANVEVRLPQPAR